MNLELIFQEKLKECERHISKMTFADILNRLEQLGLVNRKLWIQLREKRNFVAHEYENNELEMIQAMNQIYQNIKNFYQKPS